MGVIQSVKEMIEGFKSEGTDDGMTSGEEEISDESTDDGQ
jgi:hypothetical protein